MAIGKVTTGINHSLFDEFYELFHRHLKKYDDWDFELFLQIPNLRKVDILEYFENVFLDTILWDMCEFGDIVFPLFFYKK